MKHLVCAAFALSCLFEMAQPACSEVVSFTNLAAYQAVAPPQLFLLDFNGNVGATDGKGFHPLIDFDSPEATNPDLVRNIASILTDTGSTLTTNSVGPVGGRLGIPVTGIAFDLSLVEGTAQTVRLFDEAGSLVGQATTPGGNTFFGVVSTIPFKSFVVQNGRFPDGVRNDRYYIDNFRANAVPEPSALVLGLACMVVIASRRHIR